MDREKRELRKLKRTIKKVGNKRRRAVLKRDLREHPEDAAHSEFEFGDDSSATLNGLDRDSSRRRKE
jgi:hypothetical protein